MADEVIFMQTDPTFNLPLLALAELRQQDRIGAHTIISMQQAEIIDIRSQAYSTAKELVFGGQFREDEVSSRQAFARTFSTVARMCMCKATNMAIPRTWMDNPGRDRNLEKIVYEQIRGDPFHLGNEDTYRHYRSKYDQFYPHFILEDKLAGAGVGRMVDFNSIMIIFRNNFTEVVEIVTTSNATSCFDKVPGMFHSRIHVLCSRRAIREGDDGENTSLLKRLCTKRDVTVEQGVDDVTIGLNNLNVQQGGEEREED